MKIFTTLLICFLYTINTFAQQEIIGIVVDSVTNYPVPYANLVIKKANYGTITNAEGEFHLQIPQNSFQDTISCSHIGFNICKISLKQLNDNNNRICMIQQDYAINEVIIKPYDVKDIFSMILKNYDNNYPITQTSNKVHLRQYFEQEGNLKKIIDISSIISIESYKKKWPILFRSNPDVGMKILTGSAKQDTSKFAHLEYPPFVIFSIYHIPQTIIAFLSRKTKNYHFELSPVVEENKTHLKIIFDYKLDCAFKISGSMLINLENYSVENFILNRPKEYDFIQKTINCNGRTKNIKYRPTHSTANISFQKINFKYHLSQAHTIDSVLVIKNKRDTVKCEIHHLLYVKNYNLSIYLNNDDILIDPGMDLLKQIKVLSDKGQLDTINNQLLPTQSEKQFFYENRSSN